MRSHFLRHIFVVSLFLFGVNTIFAQGQNRPRIQYDMANLRADFEELREENRQLRGRLLGMEAENADLKRRISSMAKLLSAMEGRLADAERQSQRLTGEMNAALAKEREARRQEMTRFAKEISVAIEAEKGQQTGKGGNTGKGGETKPQLPPGKYQEIVVEKGDTLGAIAKAARCTVEELRKINGLKDDRIYVNMKLRIPVGK